MPNKCDDPGIWNNTANICASLTNINSILGNHAPNFISNVEQSFINSGCQYVTSMISSLQQMLTQTGINIAHTNAKIAYLTCIHKSCCAVPMLGGCMDDGQMPNTYQNNQGGNGSVTPPHAATNYNPQATVDDGSCIYPNPAIGCCDPYAVNYIDPANYPPATTILDCDDPPNIIGTTSFLAHGPYGDVSCCNYDPHPCNLNVGDIGPGGGIVFAIPGPVSGTGTGPINTSSYYFEIWPQDMAQSTMSGNPNINTNCSAAGSGGYEWGLYTTNIPSGSFGTNLGDGEANTLYISNAANGVTTGSGNGLAVDLALSASQMGVVGWYLPNSKEWDLIVNAVNSNALLAADINLTGKYWSSSYPQTVDNNKAFAVEATGAGAMQSVRPRCHTYKVRPIRKFACARGVKYNYINKNIYMNARSPGGCNMYTSSSPGIWVGNAIGGSFLQINVNKVLTSLHGIGSFMNMPYPLPYPNTTGINGWMTLISIWDKHEMLLGRWKYQVFQNTYCSYLSTCYKEMHANLISHVEGNIPILNVPDYAFVKIEHASMYGTNDPVWFADSKDLQNYAGTGTNIRMVDPVTGAPISGYHPQYQYKCIQHCGHPSVPWQGNGCHLWYSPYPPPTIGNLSGPLFPIKNDCLNHCFPNQPVQPKLSESEEKRLIEENCPDRNEIYKNLENK